MAIILKNSNIIPMNEEIILMNKDILIDEGKIKEVSDSIKCSAAETIDCTDKYVLPGLYDMHAHPNNEKYLHLFLANGVTSIRGMTGIPYILEWKDEINAGKRIGPTIYSASPLMDGIKSFAFTVEIKTPEDAFMEVHKAKEAGYLEIKTYPDIPRDAYFKLMETAKSLDMNVVGHANRNISLDELIDSGYHSIEHASILDWITGGKEENILKAAKSGMWFCPTLVVIHMLYNFCVCDHEVEGIPNIQYSDDIEKKVWEEILVLAREKIKTRGFNSKEIIKSAKLFVEKSDNVLLGTDQGNPGLIAGFSLLDELELVVSELGLSTYQAIRTGTVNAARYLGLSQNNGTVEEGKSADLLIVESNPLLCISNIKKIWSVVKSGKVYSRNALDNLLEESKNIPYKYFEV